MSIFLKCQITTMGSGENEGAILFTDVPLELVCIAGETLLPHFQTFHILNVLLKSPPKTVRNMKMFSYVKKKRKEGREGGKKKDLFWVLPPFLPTVVVLVQSCPTLCDPLDYSSTGSSVFFSQEYWSGCHFLLEAILPA